MSSTLATPYRWRFIRAGGFDQVKLETGADLLHLDELDQKLWVALACPVAGLAFDPVTASLIDTDNDGRIRACELLAAIRWAAARLSNADDLIKGGDTLPLAAINDGLPEGAELRSAACRISGTAVTLAQVSDAARAFASTLFNGDGVIVPDCAADDETKRAIGEIIASAGAVNDLSGQPGIDQARVDAFFDECGAFDRWSRGAEDPAVVPLGERTSAAAAAAKAIETKVEDFFARCRLAAFDPRAAVALNPKEEDYAALASKTLTSGSAEAADFPLARISPDAALPLSGSVNPAYAAQINTLREQAVRPLLGERAELTESEWRSVLSRLSPFFAWQNAKTGGVVEPLGLTRVRQLLAGSAHASINGLIEKDKSLARHAAALADLEKLIRFVRDLRLLCENFVNFKNLYSGSAPAIFQAGVLYLDQRSCHLCLTVTDLDKHAAMAALAGAYLAYVECVRRGSGEKLTIVALFSQGDDEDLMVGRNGVFYDRQGRDYDATIVKIISNPISLRQAFWLPYKKAVRLIEEQIAKRAATANAQSEAAMAALGADQPQPAVASRKPAIDLSIVALASVALGGIAGAFVSALAFVGQMPAWKLPFVLIGIIGLISGPSLILAYIKLRKRNLGPILDANGWAINARASINVPFGAKLTRIAQLPPGATVDRHDLYAQRAPALPKLLLVLFLVWWATALWHAFR